MRRFGLFEPADLDPKPRAVANAVIFAAWRTGGRRSSGSGASAAILASVRFHKPVQHRRRRLSGSVRMIPAIRLVSSFSI